MPVTGPAALDGQPRRRRAVLVAAPWFLAAALGVAALVTRPAATASPATPPSATASPATDAAAAVGTSVPGSPLPTSAPPQPEPVPSGSLPATTRLQVLATARAALGSAGLPADAGPADRWAIDVRLGEVSRVTGDLAVATVHALVIQLGEAGWSGPTPAAVAVPLLLSPEPLVAGPAWPLAAPPSPLAEPDAQPVPDPDPAMVVPLQDAGWTVDEVTAVDLVGGAVLRIGLVGTPPDGGERGDHTVWLLDAPGGPRLLPLDTTSTTHPTADTADTTDTTQEST